MCPVLGSEFSYEVDPIDLINVWQGGTGAVTALAAFNNLSPMRAQGDIIVGGVNGSGLRLALGTAGQVLTTDGIGIFWATGTGSGGGTGSVTSIAAGNLSPLFTTVVTNPTSTASIAYTLVNQAQNLVYASPTSGTGAPSFRSLVAGDLPGGSYPVSSVTGTTNQVTASPTTGAVVLSLPSAITTPGSLTTTTFLETNGTLTVIGSGAVNLGGGTTTVGSLNSSYQVVATQSAATNDVLAPDSFAALIGADVTLGPLLFDIRGYPSATGSSRYVRLGVIDIAPPYTSRGLQLIASDFSPTASGGTTLGAVFPWGNITGAAGSFTTLAASSTITSTGGEVSSTLSGIASIAARTTSSGSVNNAQMVLAQPNGTVGATWTNYVQGSNGSINWTNGTYYPLTLTAAGNVIANGTLSASGDVTAQSGAVALGAGGNSTAYAQFAVNSAQYLIYGNTYYGGSQKYTSSAYASIASFNSTTGVWSVNNYASGTLGATLGAATETFSVTQTGVTNSGTSTLTGTVGIGTSPITNFGLYVSPTLTGANSNGIVCYPSLIFSANSQASSSAYIVSTVHTSTYTGLTYRNLFIDTPGTTGSELGTSYQLYISAGAGFTNSYGIYQAGSEPNVFNGNVTVGGTAAVLGNMAIGALPQTNWGLEVASSGTGNLWIAFGNGTTWTPGANGYKTYGVYSNPTYATGTYTGLTSYSYYINTPTKTGSGTIATAYQIYIAAGVAATAGYGIFQAGASDLNFFAGVNRYGQTVANGTVACAFTASVGPTGAGTSIAGWEKFQDSGGTTRYRPYW